MGRSRESMTRREILKRGAIVGGGVLWVTPVVQTLGMGPAFASPVSGGASPCSMPLTVTACEYLNLYYYLTFETLIPSGCPCNPLLQDHRVRLDFENPDGFTNSTPMATFDGGHSLATLGVSIGDMLQVVCRNDRTGETLAWGDKLTIGTDTVAGCGP